MKKYKIMKRMTNFFQALLGIVASICFTLVAAGRLAWRTIRNWWKKRSKCFRRIIVTILILIPVGFAALMAYAYYHDEYGRCYWEDRYLSKNVDIHGFMDNKYRVYNHCADKYTTPKVDWISEASYNDSLTVYATSGKRGYINANTGEIIIDAKTNDYNKAWIFSEGLAAVIKDGKIGFIDSDNKVVIPFQYDYSNRIRIWGFGYLFHDNYCIMTNKEGDFGLIDTTGKWVIEPKYDEIWTPNENGYRIIIDDGKYGVLNSRCDVVYPVEYTYIYILSDGFILTKDGKRWQVDFEGNIVQPFMYNNSYYLYYPIGYNDNGDIKYEMSEYVKYEIMYQYGIMNRITGEVITPAIYSDINMLSKELFEIQDSENDNWILTDANGNVISE